MSLVMKSVQVRLEADAFDALRIVAAARNKDLGQTARSILTEALLGKLHQIEKAVGKLAVRKAAEGGGK